MMKKLMMTALSLALAVGLSACMGTGKQEGNRQLKAANAAVVPNRDLALRRASLFSEAAVAPVEKDFTAPGPGEAKVYERSFTNAPPLIPHSLAGLLPITKKHNACLDCHAPDVAESVGATSIPKTHLMDFRTKKYLGHLAPQRFYCSQCHVPQANVRPLVQNTFKPDFKNSSEKYGSNLMK
jgi:cytochrome c-type protein NapB